MLIYGAGGHAKVVMAILSACGEAASCIFDDNWHSTGNVGDHIPGAYDPLLMDGERLIVAMGNNLDRRRIAGRVRHLFGNAIHPTALVDSSVQLGWGVVVVHRAVVQAGSRVGNHVIVNTGATVDHDCILGDFAHIGPGAILCGGVRVGECTLIGAGSVVIPQVSIGKECVIGAGAVVINDVPDYSRVAGNPARIIY
jgi:sugar O-acyltransferase (sialic acid O-acetyltransferase NeuD family)